MPEVRVQARVGRDELTKAGSYISTPVVLGDHIYFGNTNGVIRCYEVKTGKKVYEERLSPDAAIYASLRHRTPCNPPPPQRTERFMWSNRVLSSRSWRKIEWVSRVMQRPPSRKVCCIFVRRRGCLLGTVDRSVTYNGRLSQMQGWRRVLSQLLLIDRDRYRAFRTPRTREEASLRLPGPPTRLQQKERGIQPVQVLRDQDGFVIH